MSTKSLKRSHIEHLAESMPDIDFEDMLDAGLREVIKAAFTMSAQFPDDVRNVKICVDTKVLDYPIKDGKSPVLSNISLEFESSNGDIDTLLERRAARKMIRRAGIKV